MKTKEEKSKYDQEYQRTYKERVTVWFNKEKDKDLIDAMINSGMSKTEFIKDIMRRYLEEHQND
jgi:hypothetical protein